MSTPEFDVIVCGSLHLDVMVYAPALPRPDETVTGRRWERKCGGKGGNQAVMAARAGARTAMIGRLGDDDFGRALRDHLDAGDVDTRAVEVDPTAGSGMSVAIVRDDGEYGAVIVSGSNLSIDPAAAANAFHALGRARIVILQNEIPEAVNVAVARAARGAGAKVVLNAAPARAMSEELWRQVDILVVNRIEAAMISGVDVADRDGAFAAAPKLAKAGCAVVVTLGGNGLVVSRAADAPIWIAAEPVTVVSTHGAGDCFVGAMAKELAQDLDLVEACKSANAYAAAFVAGRVS